MIYMKLRPFYKIKPEKWLLTSISTDNENKKQSLQENEIQESKNTEYVRQWILRELLQTYNYPNEWLNNQIILGKSQENVSTKNQDSIVLVKSKNNNSFLIIKVIAPLKENLILSVAEKELESLLMANSTATIGLVSNGMETKVIRKNLQQTNFEYVSDIPEYSADFGKNLLLTRTVNTKKGSYKLNTLQTLPKRMKNLFFEIHSTIRDIDGLHDDLALDELCKLLYTKIYDERTTYDKNSDKFRFQINGYANESELGSDIRALYSEACSYDLKINAKRIPGYERSRGVFQEEMTLSDSTLYRVVEKLQCYSIIDSDNDIKSIVFQQVLGRAIRSGMGQFFTPDQIIRLAVEVIDPNPKDIILDPFCGSGHFLTRSIDYVMSHYSQIDHRLIKDFKMNNLHGIEKSARMVRIAMTDMLLHNEGHTNILNSDALGTTDNFTDIGILKPENTNGSLAVFDVILTNPPFGKILGEESAKFLSQFQLAQKKKSLPFEILSIERCFQFLKKGGKLAIVLPDGNLANSQTQFFREWLLTKFKLKAVVSLPQETFAPYGTTTKTSLCFLQKFKNEHDKNDDYDIIFYKLDNIGYDSTGRDITGSEISDAIGYLKEHVLWD